MSSGVSMLLERNMRKADEMKGEDKSSSIDCYPLPEDLGIMDYSQALEAVVIGSRHLASAIPNGQHERIKAAYQLVMRGSSSLESWLVHKGII